MTNITTSIGLLVSMTLCFVSQQTLAESSTPVIVPIQEGQDEEISYHEYMGPDDFPYYPEEFQDHGDLSPMQKVYKNMAELDIVTGDYIVDDFVVGGVNLAEYSMTHPPFFLYEDFDIGSYITDGPSRWGWKELLRIRRNLERPSLSWYVDKVARKRWFATQEDYPQPEFYFLKYKDELSATGQKEDERETIFANLPTNHGFCAKPTHMSMTLGNWLVDIEPGNKNSEARFSQYAMQTTSKDQYGKQFDPYTCADSLAEGIQREALSLESWALKNVKPGIVVEELFSNHEDRSLPPHEFNLFVIWGKVYVGQWNEVSDARYHSGFFYRDGSTAPGCAENRLPDWVPWYEMVDIAEGLSQHKDMFRVDMFVGVPRYSPEDAELQVAVSESEIHPTTMFCNPLIAEEMARLWIAGYKIGNYETIPNDEVPPGYTGLHVTAAKATIL